MPIVKKLFVPVSCFFVCLFLTMSCRKLEQSLDIVAPPSESKLVVECYLEPEKPYRLLLTETVDYYSNQGLLPDVPYANVTITHLGKVHKLTYQNFLSSLSSVIDTVTTKVYNYTSKDIVPTDTINPFILEIKDNKGRVVSSQTLMPRQVTVDSIYYRFNSKNNKASVISRIQIEKDSYYRYFLNQGRDSLRSGFSNYILNTNQMNEIPPSTARFSEGDTVFVNIVRANKEYSDYYLSVRGAFNANFNPFTQAVTIKSNIVDGVGIFTGIRHYRRRVIIKK